MNVRRPHEPTRDFLPQSDTWDDAETQSMALGCASCVWREHCGGLHVSADAYDCLSFCSCSDRSKCDTVCPNNQTSFLDRIREIGGLSLDVVPRAGKLPVAELPDVIPYIQHNSRREGLFQAPAAAIPLLKLYNMRTGALHFQSRDELAAHFRIDSGAHLLATGVDRDPRVESWWEWFSMGTERLASLRHLGISLITVPNFSLFTNVPRLDNMHAMKRIALSWSAIMRSGMQAALHVNARTIHDYERWAAFIRQRPEVQVIAFEFGTGCGHGSRIHWHVRNLCALADEAGHPLTLVLRGGLGYLRQLRSKFSRVVMLDTDSFRRTVNRQLGRVTPSGKIHWSTQPTEAQAPLDDLLAHNVRVVAERIRLSPLPRLRHSNGASAHRARSASNADRQSGQMALLP
jgi:hypothetical protein